MEFEAGIKEFDNGIKGRPLELKQGQNAGLLLRSRHVFLLDGKMFQFCLFYPRNCPKINYFQSTLAPSTCLATEFPMAPWTLR